VVDGKSNVAEVRGRSQVGISGCWISKERVQTVTLQQSEIIGRMELIFVVEVSIELLLFELDTALALKLQKMYCWISTKHEL
jgi:hypothetical protein